MNTEIKIAMTKLNPFILANIVNNPMKAAETSAASVQNPSSDSPTFTMPESLSAVRLPGTAKIFRYQNVGEKPKTTSLNKQGR